MSQGKVVQIIGAVVDIELSCKGMYNNGRRLDERGDED